ncbi:HDL289Wp [Eremothecium sinecaudum]|uniref:LSM complex subunit LSM4 n=1 Tax=Eremothecium sinecaudum TaxID=45286 RepID=A0A0X8HS40_9SACH|nr:HDL289Wp [Eremothecium sinecaudum]AMD20455.1 HDL289Wp [Eremothecium sinecaudum]
MLPLYLLTNAKGQEMFIELKNGETIEGKLTNVDNWMNLTLSNVIHTASDQSLQLPEIYLRGSFIKYIKLQDDIIDKVKQQLNSGKDGNNSGGGSNQMRDRDSGRRFTSRRENVNSSGGRAHQDYQRKRGGGNFQRRDGQYNSNSNRRSRQPQNNGPQGSQTNNGSGGFIQYHQSQYTF